MGNPTLKHPFRASGVAPPAAPPPGPLEVRCCALCSHCLEITPWLRGARVNAECDWQGRWEWPDKGCGHFELDLASLGDEGLDG